MGRERCQGGLYMGFTLPVLNQAPKIQGQAVNSLIQLGIALE